jgi:serine/threonine-protein kinase
MPEHQQPDATGATPPAGTPLPRTSDGRADVTAPRTGPTVHAATEHYHGDAGPLPALDLEPAAARYELADEIARGGMGSVLRGFDRTLRRELAVKVLLERHRADPVSLRRFVEEARIGGGLQHPGVVPVYELGTLPDGRPFFAMKLVEGRTLAELLHERPSPAHELPRWLQVFEQVCQTVAYAHSRGVIHRDLKPANVMVGAFGEVQVMDWGLAKALRGGEAKWADTDLPSAGKPAAGPSAQDQTTLPDQSRPGAVVGTAAYMPPEQARGELDRPDERSDVFGLGAILCEVLTGLPPYVGLDRSAVVRKAAAADLGPALARLDGSGADPALVRLAKDCLAPERDGRPRDAKAVAGAVEGYLGGLAAKLKAAEIDRAAAQVQAREERKRRRLTLLLGAAVVAALAAGGAGYWWVHQESARREEALAREADRNLQEAATLRDQARALVADPVRGPAALAGAQEAVRRAEAVLAAGGPAELRDRAAALAGELQSEAQDRAVLAQLDRARMEQALAPAGGGGGTAAAFAAAFRSIGFDPAEPVEQCAERLRGRTTRRDLVTALADWAVATPDAALRRHLLAVADRLDDDPDSLRSHWRDALAQGERDKLRELARPEQVSKLPASACYQVARSLARAGDPDGAVRLLRQAQQQHPQHFWVNLELAQRLTELRPPRTDEATRYYTAALALRNGNPDVWAGLGAVLERRGRYAEAATAYQRASDLQPDAGALRERRVPRPAPEPPAAARTMPEPAPSPPRQPKNVLSLPSGGGAGQAPRETYRLAAARAAAQAGTGEGEDAPADDAERARLRREALQSLRAELAAWDRQANDPAARAAAAQTLAEWQTDPAFAGLRDPKELAKLPAAEREPFEQFWADVATRRAQWQPKRE